MQADDRDNNSCYFFPELASISDVNININENKKKWPTKMNNYN